MRIRKRIKKRFEHDKDGVQVSAAVNAVVAANVNEAGANTQASSRQRVVQREGEKASEPGAREPSDSAPHAGERARELPDREGTYNELREAAAEAQETEGAEDD